MTGCAAADDDDRDDDEDDGCAGAFQLCCLPPLGHRRPAGLWVMQLSLLSRSSQCCSGHSVKQSEPGK